MKEKSAVIEMREALSQVSVIHDECNKTVDNFLKDILEDSTVDAEFVATIVCFRAIKGLSLEAQNRVIDTLRRRLEGMARATIPVIQESAAFSRKLHDLLEEAVAIIQKKLAEQDLSGSSSDEKAEIARLVG